MVSVLWFRRDLRIDDHKALAKAIASQVFAWEEGLNDRDRSSSV